MGKRRFAKFLSMLLCCTLMLTMLPSVMRANAADVAGAVYVAPDGHDDSGSGSIDNPYASLSKAISQVSGGQTIYLRAGSYQSAAPVSTGGKGNFTICSYNGEKVTLDFQLQLVHSSNVTVTGLTMVSPGTAIVCNGANTVNISNMDITGRVYVYDSYYVTVNANRLHDNADDAAAVTLYYGRYSRVFNNLIYNNTQYGVYVLESALQSVIYNNTFYANALDDVLIKNNPSSIIVQNNIFQKGFEIDGSAAVLSNNTIDNNFYDADTGGIVAKFVDPPTGAVTSDTFAAFRGHDASTEKAGRIGDPMLADAPNADFHLLKGSPCINCAAQSVGTSDGKTVTAPDTDYYGGSREFPDIGAAEYIPSVPAEMLPGSVSFSDKDPESGKIAGTVSWTAAADESAVVGYGVFYILSDGSTQQIGTDVAKGAAYELALPTGTVLPGSAVKLEVVAKTADGYLEKGTAVALKDFAPPLSLAQGVSFVDNDFGKGEIGGTVTWQKAADESDIDAYEVYFADSSDQRISQIGSDVPVGSAYSLTVPKNTPIPEGAVKIAVYSKNSSGLSSLAASFMLFDTTSADVYVSPDGNDANDGSIAHPLATVGRAAGVMPDGSTIYLRAGIYDEAATIQHKNNLTLTAYAGETAVITHKTLFQYCSGVTVKNLSYRPADYKNVLQADQCQSVVFENLDVDGSVTVSSASGFIVQNSFVHDSAEEGGITLVQSKNGEIVNNVLYNNTKQGIYLLGSGTTGNLIAHNTLYDNAKADVLLNSLAAYGTAGANTFYNNIFTKELSIGSDAGVTGNTFDYNLYDTASGSVMMLGDASYSLSQFQSYASGSREVHGFIGDAGFYNAPGADFRLTSGSGAIDRGLADASLPQADLLGRQRDGSPDIGAYEYDDSIDTCLQILSHSPTGLSEKTDDAVTVQFSDTLAAVQPVGCVEVLDGDGSPVPGSLSVNGKTLTFTPTSELDYDTVYTVTLSASIADAAGSKTLGQNFSWTFKTRNASDIGRTYYISPDGKDDNPGTIEAPMRDITAASAMLQPGDTLILRGGTYNGTMLIWGKGSPDSDPITVRNYDGEDVRVINTISNTSYILYVGASYNVHVSGITATNDGSFVDGNKTGNYGMYIHQSKNVTIDHCTFYDGSGGMIVRNGSENITVNSCVFHDEYWRYGGITLYNESSFSGVKNCSFYNNVFYNDYYGILFYGGLVSGNRFYNNTFYNDLLDISVTTNLATFKDNVFENNIFSSLFEINQNFTGTNQFDYNLYNSDQLTDGSIAGGLTLSAFQQTGQEVHGKYGSARLTNPDSNDFSLTSGSSAIAMGDNFGSPAVDFDGISRNGVIDAGAYKFAGGDKLYVAPNGSDDAGGSASSPFRTIGRAVQEAGGNDTIFIKAGRYAENLHISDKNAVTLKAYGDGEAVLTGSVTIEDSADIAMYGLQWEPAAGSAFEGSHVQRLTLSGMVLAGGVSLSGVQTFTIECSILRDSPDALILNDCEDGSVVNNQLIRHGGSAVRFADGSNTGILVVNNTFYGNGKDISVSASGQTGNTIKNNIFSSGLVLGSEHDLTDNVWNYNCYDKALATVATVNGMPDTLAQIQALNSELKGFSGDPQFADQTADDFRISYYSECRSAGTGVGAPLKDFNGVTRKKPVDIGAYEYSGITKTYYVSSQNGNDSSSGTENAPFKTIQHAADLIRPMETLVIRGGTYQEAVKFADKKGTSYGYLSIKAFPGETVILDGGSSLAAGLTLTNSSYVRVDGLTIQNFTDSELVLNNTQYITAGDMVLTGGSESALSCENTQNSSFTKLQIQNGAQDIGKIGIGLTGGGTVAVTQSEIRGKSESAVAVSGTDGVTVTSSIITGSGNGVSVKNAAGLILYNNTMYGNTGYDLFLGAAAVGAKIRNNIFASKDTAASCYVTQSGNTLDYNHYADKDKTADLGSGVLALTQVQAAGQEANASAGDPMFYDAGQNDFDLQKGSPCIGGGLSDSNTPKLDFSGSAFLSPVDRGARFSPLSFNIYYVSNDGDDQNDGSLSHPWKTIKKGMQSLKPSDTLYIRGGSYNERVDIDQKNGVNFRGEQLWYTVQNYPGETAVLNSNDSQDIAIKFTKSSYWLLKGLQFTGYLGCGVWTATGTTYVVMDSLKIWDISNPAFIQSGVEGILGDGGSYCTVRNCTIYDIGQERMSGADHAIYIGYGANHWTIDSNLIYNIPGGAINLYGAPCGGDYSTITNNVVFNSADGVVITRTKGAVISNNTFYDNWYNDIYMDYNVNDNIIQNNVFYNDLPLDYKAKVQDLENLGTMLISVHPTVFGIYDSGVDNNIANGPIIKDNIFRNNAYCYKYFTPAIRCLTPEGINGQFINFTEYAGADKANTFLNNFEADPKFMSPAAHDFSLTAYSPMINAGIAENAPSNDVTGAARVGKPDIGAYECFILLKSARLTCGAAELKAGRTTPLSLSAAMNDGSAADLSKASVRYVVSNPCVAGVANGTLTARAKGKVTVYAIVTIKDTTVKSNSVTVTVTSNGNGCGKHQKHDPGYGSCKGINFRKVLIDWLGKAFRICGFADAAAGKQK